MAARVDVHCGTCNIKINLTDKKGLKCTGNCGKSFHTSCANIDDKSFKKLTKENGKKWICATCNKRKRSTETSPLPIVSKKTKSDNTSSEMSSDEESEIDYKLDKNAESADQLQKILDTMRLQGNQQARRMDTLTQKFNTKMETFETMITENADDIVDLRNENAELKKELLAMKSDINVIQQQKLADTIEIAGVVAAKDEDLKLIVTSIAKAANVNLNIAEIINIYRKMNGKICTKLSTMEKANLMISGSFKTQLTNTMIGNSNKSNTRQTSKTNNAPIRIYINNAMTSLNQLLYKRLRDLKKDNKITKFAFRNSYFVVKKNENDKFKPVYNENQLNQLNDE